jgi:hypothetical protein
MGCSTESFTDDFIPSVHWCHQLAPEQASEDLLDPTAPFVELICPSAPEADFVCPPAVIWELISFSYPLRLM